MSDGKPLSLAENDMIAIKATARFAFFTSKRKGICNACSK